ncbi:MAG: amino acid adenylation domain-containing protein [Frankiaceae bacterium]
MEQARRAPNSLAVSAPDGALTYGGLDRRANRLAAVLRAHGLAKGDRVVIWLDKSAAAVVAMQAALRVGAAYVPVASSNPPARTAKIVADCRARIVLTDADRVASLRDVAGDCRVLDIASFPLGDPLPAPVEHVPVAPDDLAYVLYTSGSTGEPKGVCVSHRGAMAFVEWAAAELGAGPEDRFANHAPFNFDLSVLDLYVAFRSGASVHVLADGMAYAPSLLVDFLVHQRITVWYSVPSVLGLMLRDGGLLDGGRPPALRALLFAGEPFPVAQLRELYGAWGGYVRFLNLYGPTETNVCTFHEVTDVDVQRDRPVPIGHACSGDLAWVETADGRLGEPGEEGELLVEGPTVMLGYWGRPRHEGPYRTGDIVRVLAPGVFDYVGRRDHMVKVRGHRVEPGEIEAVLARHPSVESAVVVVSGTGMAAELVAFVVPRGLPPSLLDLKRHCSEHLPRYMIVDRLRAIDALPRTPNGKTDRRALLAALDERLAS